MQSGFKVLTNSVSQQMQEKLYQIGLINNSSMMGIDPKSTALAMAITRLFHADQEGKFHSMKLGGILCLVADRKVHSRFLRLYDINTNEMLFQCELYINFADSYRELNDYFFSFPLERLHIGVQFANVHDASTFKNLIQTYSFKGENPQTLAKEHRSKQGNQNLDITKPMMFERKEHAGWDPSSQTFILNEVPKEIKLLLKKAGFKKKDLKKKETALAIYEILLREIEFDNNPKSLIGIKNNGVRTSSDLNSKGFLSNRMSNEDSRIYGERTGSNMNFGLTTQNNHLGIIASTMHNMDYLDPKSKQGAIQNHLLTSAARTSNLPGKSPNLSPDPKEEQKIGKPPVPPPMGMIPPPPSLLNPIGMGMPPPPMMGGKIQPPPLPVPGVQNQNLSFNELLIQQSKNLKKVQENQINNKVKNLSESQQMKITMNLAVVLEQRKKALQNDDKKNNNDSDEDSDEEANDSDDSAW